MFADGEDWARARGWDRGARAMGIGASDWAAGWSCERGGVRDQKGRSVHLSLGGAG